MGIEYISGHLVYPKGLPLSPSIIRGANLGAFYITMVERFQARVLGIEANIEPVSESQAAG